MPGRLTSAAGRWAWIAVAVVPAALVAWPVVAVLRGIVQPERDLWRHQWETRLPDAIVSSIVLVVGVSITSAVLGVGLAWLVAAHRFPGRRFLGWALVLPLAIPAYILGFVTTSVLGVAGPVQTWWRDTAGRDAWFPEVRSMPVAIAVLSLTLYPYVYLLARAALAERAGSALAVARSLGASRSSAARRVVLPMLRPAIAAGLAIVAMETLTDFATVQYFQVDTVTAVVFRVWRGTYDREGASELAVLVLVFAIAAIAFERLARGRARFAEPSSAAPRLEPEQLHGPAAWAATAAASTVVLVAFCLPVLRLATWALAEQRSERGTPQVERFGEYLSNSASLTLTTVAICLAVATLVANAERFAPSRIIRVARRVATSGYAIPGPVVAMGVVISLVGLDRVLDGFGYDLPGTVATGSFLALVFAYAVRFLAPAVTTAEGAMDRVPADVTDSARSLGSRPLGVLARVHLPLTRASLLTAAVLVGVDALKELPVALLLRPIGFDTLPVWVYNLASESRFQQAALPALAIVSVAIVPVAILTRRLEPRR